MSNCIGDLQPSLQSLMTITICKGEEICDWGGNNVLCCKSCPNVSSCLKVCKHLNKFEINGEKCEHMELLH